MIDVAERQNVPDDVAALEADASMAQMLEEMRFTLDLIIRGPLSANGWRPAERPD